MIDLSVEHVKCSFAQVGKCIINLIGGVESLPYVDDPRYNPEKIINKAIAKTNEVAELAVPQSGDPEIDVLHRMRFPYDRY